jgi:FixJ family two-component response regulator
MGGQPVVAVVDDDESVRMALASLVRSDGFAVLLFASAEELLHRKNLPSIGCLILDWRLPGMDGLQLQRYLGAKGWRVPIIFLTAHRSEEGRARALTAGAIAFLSKPFDVDTLLNAVKAGLEAR